MSKARDLANAGTALTSVTPTELGYLDGVTSAVQTQINNIPQYTLPSQTGNSGKFLTTNGSTESWANAAKATEIFDLTTSREWLNTANTAAGNYNMVVTTGTANVYVYNSSNELIHEFAITTTASINTISTSFARMEAVGSTSNNLSITPAASVTTSTGGTLSLDVITGSGTYGVGTGTATGGTSGYVAGQLAHVVVVAGSGGSGGGGGGSFSYVSGRGGIGGVIANSTPITLSGTYTLTVGIAGTAGNAGDPGTNGGAGGNSSGFGLSATGGGGGERAKPGNGAAGADGGPSLAPITSQIFSPATATKLGIFNGAAVSGSSTPGNPGNAGKIFVLRWTP